MTVNENAPAARQRSGADHSPKEAVMTSNDTRALAKRQTRFTDAQARKLGLTNAHRSFHKKQRGQS